MHPRDWAKHNKRVVIVVGCSLLAAIGLCIVCGAFALTRWTHATVQLDEQLFASTLPVRLQWEYRIEEDILEPPWSFNNTVFITKRASRRPIVAVLEWDTPGGLDAVDANTGKQRWAFPYIPGDRRSTGLGLDGGDQVVVVLYSSTLAGLDARDGFVKWQHTGIFYSLIADERTVYASHSGRVQAYDLATGILLWTSEYLENERSTSLALDGNSLYAIGMRTWVLDPETGRVSRVLDIQGTTQNLTLMHQGKIIRQERDWQRDKYSETDWLAAFDAETGEQLWRKPYWPWTPYWRETIVDNLLLFRSHEGTLMAVDLNTGELQWEYVPESGVEVISNVANLQGHVYFLASDKTLRAVDLKTGAEIGQLKSSYLRSWHNIEGDPILVAGVGASDDTLFVSFGGHTVYAFTPTD